MKQLVTSIAAATASVAVLSLASCGLIDERVLRPADLEGTVSTETREHVDFTQIDLRGSGDVDVVVGEKFEVTVTADDALLPLLETSVSDSTLVLDQNFAFVGDRPEISYTVTMPDVGGLAVAGSGHITSNAINSAEATFSVTGSGSITATGRVSEARVDVSGSGSVDLMNAAVRDGSATVAGTGSVLISTREALAAEIAGSGTIEATGVASSATIEIAGSGDFLGESFDADQARITIAGSGDVWIGVSEELTVSTAGSGDVVYSGDPSVAFDKAGSGTVSRADS
jgi:hypothetical protein